jgi:hypothetical protein
MNFLKQVKSKLEDLGMLLMTALMVVFVSALLAVFIKMTELFYSALSNLF